MNLPLSNAETLVMPELHRTRTYAAVRADTVCGWCGIKLSAVPEAPVPVNGRYYHPETCLTALYRTESFR